MVMLFHLALSYLASAVHALPLQAIAIDNLASPSSSPSCEDLQQCRTIWNIIQSCLATIFTCTWVAVHPNVPSADESHATITFRRITIVLVALIAPEFIIMWAARQWLAARESVKAMKKLGKGVVHSLSPLMNLDAEYIAYIFRIAASPGREWSVVHGFFASMGGFKLSTDAQSHHPLDARSIVYLVKNGYVDFPDITEKEIKDKSKGDPLSKGLVILQTGWFVLQCIARGVERLPVTELEIVTLAFATLNMMTYALWWNKPLHVRCAVPVVLKKHMSSESNHWRYIAREFGWTRRPRIYVADNESDADGPWIPVRAWSERANPFRKINEWTNLLPGFLYGIQDFKVDLTTLRRVPTYYAGRLEDNPVLLADFGMVVVGVVFGAIHCIAWSFPFSTHTEQILWRSSSIIIVCVPILLFLMTVLLFAMDEITYLLVLVMWLAVPAYFIARLALLVQAFVALRSLPSGAYQPVFWTTFIPHF